MPRKRAPVPTAGLIAFVVTLAMLVTEFALLAVPHRIDTSHWPPDSNTRARRDAEEIESRARRFVAGVVVLGVGSGLGGYAALIAARGRHADRALAAAAGVCCLMSALVCLALAVSGCFGAVLKDADEGDRAPVIYHY